MDGFFKRRSASAKVTSPVLSKSSLDFSMTLLCSSFSSLRLYRVRLVWALCLLSAMAMTACNDPDPTISRCYPDGQCNSIKHPKQRRPFTAKGGDIGQGEIVYQKNCVPCHGTDGRGVTLYQTRDLTDPAWQNGNTDGDIRKVIIEGRIKMPPFNLQEGDLKNLISFLRSIKKAESPEPY